MGIAHYCAWCNLSGHAASQSCARAYYDRKRAEFTVEIDREKEVITICGVPYAFDLFKALGRFGWPDGTKLEIVNRDPAGAVTLRRLEAEELPLNPEDERLMSHG